MLAGRVWVNAQNNEVSPLSDDEIRDVQERALVRAELYTVAYRVVERNDQPALDFWPESLAIGATLSTMPLWLRGDVCVPIALGDTHRETCLRHRNAVPE